MALLNMLMVLLLDIQHTMFNKAKAYQQEHITHADTLG